MAIVYSSYEEREPDTQYRNLLKNILDNGTDVDPQQGESARMILGCQWRFPLANGFPIITERDLISPQPKSSRSIFEMSIAELCAFLGGARNQKELESYGCSWWKRWLTAEKCRKRGLEPGDAGPGSYGAAWRNFPKNDGTTFDQITHLVEQLKGMPHLRTHFVSPWIPQYIGRGTDANGKQKIQKVVVAPCHGWIHVLAYPCTRQLSLHHFQRSGDVPVGVVGNLIQYAALTLMLAQVAGYEARELVYTISDAHIYAEQRQDVRDLLATRPAKLPTVKLDPDISNIFEFRPNHFKVEDYTPQLPPRTIWTPV